MAVGKVHVNLHMSSIVGLTAVQYVYDGCMWRIKCLLIEELLIFGQFQLIITRHPLKKAYSRRQFSMLKSILTCRQTNDLPVPKLKGISVV